MRHSDLICIKRIKGKGRGVFALRDIPKGAVIERVPVMLIPVKQVPDGFHNPALARFCFYRDRATLAVALGYGSLYNHSYRPNARYDDERGPVMVFTALRKIAAGEEITVNYNGEPRDRSPVDFEVL